MDMTVRLGAAVALIGLGALLGKGLSAAGRRRAEALGALAVAADALKRHMLDRRLPLPDALEATNMPAFEDAAHRLRTSPGTPAECWRDARDALTRRGQALDCLMPEDMGALDALFNALGAGDSKAQRDHLSEAARALGALSESARKTCDEQGKLYTSLGALAGMALSVMLV